MESPWHVYVMAFLYGIAGWNHFRNPKVYIKIIPSYFSNPSLINNISGIAEIVLAIGLCFPPTRPFAAWGIMLMLLAFIPTHVYMLQNEKASLKLPKWLLILRLPLQLVLIYWAYMYT